MKKRFSLIIMCLLFIFMLASCNALVRNKNSNAETPPVEKNDGYKVLFVTEYGEVEAIEKIKKLPELPKLEEQGYIFLGWSYEENSNDFAKKDDEVKKDITLYAIWEQITYSITYDANGHGTAPSKVENTLELPNPLPTMEEEGFEFLGWSRIKNSKYLVKEGDKINSNVVLYGIWQSEKIEDRSYTVSYYSAYGDTPDAETNVTTLPNELPLLEDDEYIFLGWTYDRLTNELVKPGEPIESDVRLYAVWGIETHTISFDAMGYGIAPSKISNVLAIPDELPTMKYDGCVFLGWTLNPNTNVLVESGTEISTDIKLYAVWEETGFNISYVANGHGTAPNDDFSSRIPDPLPTMEEEGYTFEGWSEYDMSTKLVRPGDKLTKDITLYGVWKEISYRITYHNNGRGTTPPEKVGVKALPNPLPTMTVDGYEFIGWGLREDSNAAVVAGTKLNKNIDLYAIWELKTYNIKYNANGHGTAPSPTLGATKFPDPLPKINDTDNYAFKGWSETSDSSTLVQAGKEIYEDLTLYAVWVSKEAYVTSLDLTQSSKNYILENKLDSNDIDTDLAKIVYVATYSDGTEVEVKADKSMFSNSDYESLKTPGKHEVYINVLGIDLGLLILYTEKYWSISYYSRGDLYQQAYKFMDGSNANTPQKPEDYLDENNVLWTFDKWSQSDEEVHENLEIHAVFKKVILFDYYVSINSSSEATIVFSYDNTRVIKLDMRILDKDTKALIYQIQDLDETYELTSLAKDKMYVVTGTYTISYNEANYDLDIDESTFTTRLVSDLDDIEYEVDTRAVSSHSISLDVSQYAEGAPLNYSLYKVYLLDLDGKLVGEWNYTEEDTIAYFDGLDSDTEYQTMFYYCEIKDNSSSAKKMAAIPSYEIEFKPEYGFCFRGFNVFTSNSSLEHKEVKLVYNDPVRGKKVLYRYYVSEGGSVYYRTYEYSNPFTFALPTIYNEYYAFGDYSKLKNITEDKEVEVHLVRKRWYEGTPKKHTVIFVGYSDKNRWEENQYIISVKEVEDGGSITPPINLLDYDAYLPDETDKYTYEAAWDYGLYRYCNIDFENVKESGVLYSYAKAVSKNTVTVYSEPELRVETSSWWPSLFIIGPDYVILNTSISNSSAIIKSNSEHVIDGVTAYLTEGALNSNGRRIESTYIDDYNDCFAFNDLDGVKYVAHIVFQYDTNDGTGLHTMHYAIPFALQERDYNTNVNGSSPNYHTIEVVNSNHNDNRGFTLIPNDLNGYTFARYYLMNDRESEKITYRYLNTNRSYKLYTFDVEKTLSVYEKIDEEERIFTTNDCISTEGVQHIVAKSYQTITTMDGIKPTSIVLEVPCENHTLTYTIGSVKTTKVYNLMLDYNEVDLSMYRLRIGNYTEQVDIGPINLEFYVYHREYGNDPERSGERFVLNFEFDSELGYYTCTGVDNAYNGYEWTYEWKQRELYQAFFHNNDSIDYSIHVQIYYNGTTFHSIYLPRNNSSTVENTNHGPNESYIYYYPYKITRFDN